MHVVSALEYERPVLALLYQFVTMHCRGSTRRVPACVRFMLNCIAEEVSGTSHYPCDSVLWTQTWSLPSGQMVASHGRTRKRCPKKVVVGLVGSPTRGLSVGFRLRLETGTDHLDSGGARSSSLVESFRGAPTQGTATSSDRPSHLERQQGQRMCTKMTTFYPSSALVMELAAEVKRSRVQAQVEWT